MRDNFNMSYQQDFAKLVGRSAGIEVKSQPLKKAFTELLKSKNVKVTKDGLDFTVSKLKAQPGEVGRINDVWKALNNWNDFSVKGVNEFKQIVGSFTGFADELGRPAKSSVLSSYYGKVDGTIKNTLPDNLRTAYTAMNKRYTDNIGLFDDMVNAFSGKDPFTKIAGVFGKNKDNLRQVLNFYEEKSGDSLMAVVGGREMALEKSAAFGFLNPRSWIDFFYSPELQAKTVTTAGKTFKGLGKVRDFLAQDIF